MKLVSVSQANFFGKIHFLKPHLIVLLLIFTGGCGTDNKNVPELSSGTLLVSDTFNWSVRMTESEIHRRGESLKLGGTDPNTKWKYQTGLFLEAVFAVWEDTHDLKYLKYVRDIIDSFIEENGNIMTYSLEDYDINQINPGNVLLKLFEISGESKYKSAADTLRKQLEQHPRTREHGLWHKKKYPWQMWLEDIYMASPFYTHYSKLLNQSGGFDDVVRQIRLIDSYTRDPKTGLRYHGWDESNKMAWADPETGCSPNFWSRAMGLYAMALIDVLDYLPNMHPKRQQILFILQDLCQAIAKHQDTESSLWYQVMDQGGCDGNYLEASASSMFVYTLAKATRMKYIEVDYWEVANKGYQGILKQFIRIDTNGLVTLTNVCLGARLGGVPYCDGSFEYYIGEPVVDNDLQGVGPFIMASVQIERGLHN